MSTKDTIRVLQRVQRQCRAWAKKSLSRGEAPGIDPLARRQLTGEAIGLGFAYALLRDEIKRLRKEGK